MNDEEILARIQQAGREAFEAAIASGLPLVMVQDGNLVRRDPDGTLTVLRPAPSHPVKHKVYHL